MNCIGCAESTRALPDPFARRRDPRRALFSADLQFRVERLLAAQGVIQLGKRSGAARLNAACARDLARDSLASRNGALVHDLATGRYLHEKAVLTGR